MNRAFCAFKVLTYMRSLWPRHARWTFVAALFTRRSRARMAARFASHTRALLWSLVTILLKNALCSTRGLKRLRARTPRIRAWTFVAARWRRCGVVIANTSSFLPDSPTFSIRSLSFPLKGCGPLRTVACATLFRNLRLAKHTRPMDWILIKHFKYLSSSSCWRRRNSSSCCVGSSGRGARARTGMRSFIFATILILAYRLW
mmetsp:Transcript_85659/g.262094  ORF Transcript_85659/g.262094 Transcript_85659/m.262094 type:complete len:202 (-) Transcript_85659:582-1187(-)